jgi:hypothetical protein
MQITKLRIFYIHYNAKKYEAKSRDPNKLRPELFSYENCFDNLIQSIRNSKYKAKVELSIWFDGNFDDLQNDFIYKNLPSDIKTQILHAEFRGGTKSCMALVEYIAAAEYAPNDLIYLLENDYNHQMDWLDKTVELTQSNIPFDYISLYDHADNYRLPLHQRMNIQLYFSESQIWKTGLSTCWSFLAFHKTLFQDQVLLKTNEDFMLFVKLNLIGRRLITAVPGLSTHCMKGYESPAVDWKNVRASVMQTES